MTFNDWTSRRGNQTSPDESLRILAADVEAVLDPTVRDVWIDEFAGTPRGNEVALLLAPLRRDITVAITAAKIRKTIRERARQLGY